MSASASADFAQRLEALDYSALWIPESIGRHPFVHAGWLLANTSKLILATGIASIYNRDPGATVAAARTLAEQSGGRFILGLGVSHRPMVEAIRGHRYGKPVTTMNLYLEQMERALYRGPEAPERPWLPSWGSSDRYLRGVGLANTKLSELEIANFKTDATSGVFEQDPEYRWQLDTELFASPLNRPDAGIQLSQVTLQVMWEEGRREHRVRLASLYMEGTTHPAPDVVMLGNVSGFGTGGTGSIGADGGVRTSADGPSGPQSITGTGNPTKPTGPGLVQPLPGASQPAVDPNFQFDISGNPVGQPPSGQRPLLGITGGGG